MDDKPKVLHGKDDMTFSLNDKRSDKTEDWQNDWSGIIVFGGVEYYLNGYQKNDGWIAGKVKPKKEKPNPVAAKKSAYDDEIPFLK